MRLVQSPARIARATRLRNLAVDLVALRGAMTDARDGDKTIQVMTFNGVRLDVLYKTPRVTLSTGGAPQPVKVDFRPAPGISPQKTSPVKALLVANDFFETQLDELSSTVSAGHARGRYGAKHPRG